MDTVTVMLNLDNETLKALRNIAQREGCCLADLVRDAVRRDLLRRRKAGTKPKYDPRTVAAMREILAADFARAQNWPDLHQRVRRKGYELRKSGGGLAVFEPGTNRRLAKASHFGTSLATLRGRFEGA